MRLALGPVFVLLNLAGPLAAQTIKKDTVAAPLLTQATLQDVIAYAIKNQPVIQQSLIDERITENQVRSRLADWYPQVNFNYNL